MKAQAIGTNVEELESEYIEAERIEGFPDFWSGLS